MLDESKDSGAPVSTHTTGMSPGKEKLYKDLVFVKDDEINILKEELGKKDLEIQTLANALTESEKQTSALIEQLN